MSFCCVLFFKNNDSNNPLIQPKGDMNNGIKKEVVVMSVVVAIRKGDKVYVGVGGPPIWSI